MVSWRATAVSRFVSNVSLTFVIVSHDISFESCAAGMSVPSETWDETCNICECCVIVEESPVPGACVPCDANPIGLICHCKGARKTGICYHILFVTHIILRSRPEEQKPMYNLFYMNSKIKGASKAGKRPKRVKHCLIREDSSDEEEAPPSLLKW